MCVWIDKSSSYSQVRGFLEPCCRPLPHRMESAVIRMRSPFPCPCEAVSRAHSVTCRSPFPPASASVKRTGNGWQWKCFLPMGSTSRSMNSLFCAISIDPTTTFMSSGAESAMTGPSSEIDSGMGLSRSRFAETWKYTSVCAGSSAALRAFHPASHPAANGSESGPHEQCTKCASAASSPRSTTSVRDSTQHGQRTEKSSHSVPWWSDGQRPEFELRSPKRGLAWACFTRSMASERRLPTSAKNTNGHPFLCTSLATSRRRMFSPSGPFDRPQRCGPSHLDRNRPFKNSPIDPPSLYRMHLSQRANNRLS